MNKDPVKEFEDECKERIESYESNKPLQQTAHEFMTESWRAKYSYNFSWLGRPIIQYPVDIILMQEIIWKVRPDLIIETGIAHGGSIIFSASMLELLGRGQVIGIDIDIRKHNRKLIESHPMFKRIKLIEGSSISDEVVQQVLPYAKKAKAVLVYLDSNHTEQHVLKELEMYSPLVTTGSYCVVFDTVTEYMPRECCANRPWDIGNNPMTAVEQFLKSNNKFKADRVLSGKALVSGVPKGFLKKIK